MNDIAIKFENISKQYRLGLVSTRTLSHDLNRWWHTNVLRKDDPYLKIGESNDRSKKGDSEYVWALKDINFEVKKGEVLGIIGKNGAGKSTLLKILSRVTIPTTGIIQAQGRIASLLEVGTGFHPELTGRENIYMNGSIMGMSRAEITRKLEEIVEFAGVARYIDTPTKRYSSGMTVRLGFSIAAHLEPEILVVDEVLAVGDAEFQKKAIGKMQDVSKGEGRTVLFVSHNMGAIKNLCQRGVLLENGRLSEIGDIDFVISHYLSASNNAQSYINTEIKNSPVYVKSIAILDSESNEKNSFLHTDSIFVNIKLNVNELIEESRLLVIVQDQMERRVFGAEKLLSNQTEFTLEVFPSFLTRGHYSLLVIAYKPAVSVYDTVSSVCDFSVVDGGSDFAHLDTFNYGVVFGNFAWR